MAVVALRHPFGGENQDLGLIFFINQVSLRENAIHLGIKKEAKSLFF
jgi:hypothetical protein